jgi:filamentous hemagglutinin family protein
MKAKTKTAARRVNRNRLLVSCIMPTANRRRFVPEAIRLFLAQDYREKELVVLDDGEDTVADLIPHLPQIRYLRLNRRHSIGAKRNIACEAARGGIIAHWDDDDWYAPWRLSCQVAEILRGGADICGLARMLFFDPAAQRAWEYVYPERGVPWVYGATFCYRKRLWQQNPFPDVTGCDDTLFIANLTAGVRLRVQPRAEMYVGLIHSANGSPKRTQDPLWRPQPLKRVRRVVGSNWAQAPRRATSADAYPAPVSALSTSLGAATMIAGVLSVSVDPAYANPKGGQVSAGSAAITQASPTQLDIVQSTNRAAIDWQSFSIAPNEQTNFQQPAASSVTLNRVPPGDPSVIAGKLTANGQIVLINPSGITFSRGSVVDVNSLVATPTDISNANFMAGQMKFDKPSTDPRAAVVNQGSITVAQKGLAALVAPGVANSGTIQAKLGKVVLGGAQTYTVDFYGDGLISFDVGSNVKTVPVGPDGKPMTSLVSNTGRISAPGGTVLLTADAAAGIVANVVDVPGRITARTSGQTSGSVTIDAGPGGGANISGKIDVSGPKTGQTGGSATVTGGTVNLASTARIAARGSAGGGTVRIGGGPHGQDPTVHNAQTTTVAVGAVIDASATANGSGGQVTVWSDQATQFGGTIRARGGPSGGDGGWAETSGASGLTVLPSAQVDAAAPMGKAGNWLLDPGNLTVSYSNSNITPANGSGPTVTPTGNDATVDARVISGTLNAGTNVTLTTVGAPGSENGDITVNAFLSPPAFQSISWSTPVQLTLNAAGNISILTPISGSNSGSALALNAGLAPGAIGSVTQSAAITVGTLTGSSTGGTFLTAANHITSLGAFTDSSSFGISLTNVQPLTVTGPVNAGSTGFLTLTTTGTGSDLTFTAGLTGSTVVLNSGGAITQTGGAITAGSLAATGTSVTLDGANAVTTLAGQATGSPLTGNPAAGSFSFRNDSQPLTIGQVQLSNIGSPPFASLSGVTTAGGGLTVVTTGPSTGGFNLAVDFDIGVRSSGGPITLMAGGRGGTFTNSGFVNSTFSDSVTTGGPVVILADAMTLRPPTTAGSISAGPAPVVLGPVTLTSSIALGGAGASGLLGLQQTDLDSISAGQLQIGYRNENGTPSLTGNINIASPIAINTSQVPSLLLVTGGSVTQNAGATITALLPTSPPSTPPPLSLGVIAGGPVTLGEANQVDTVAGFVDGATNSFLFHDNSVTVSTLPASTIGVAFDASGIPSSANMIGPATNPLSGIVSGGPISLTAGVIFNGTFSNISTITSSGAITLTVGTDGEIANEGTIMSSGGSVSLTAGSGGTIINDRTSSNVARVTSSGAITLTVGTNSEISNFGMITSSGGPISLTAGSGGTIINDAGTIGSNGGAITLVAGGADSAIMNTGTVSSGGGAITLTAGGITNAGAIDSTSISAAAAGNILILADAIELFADPSTVNAGASGTVVLGPVTLTDSIALGGAGSAGTLGLLPADLATVTAGMLQIGYRNVNGTPSLTGNINIAAPITIDTTKISSLLLVTDGGVTELPGGFINSPAGGPLALGIIAGGPVSMGQANEIGTLAGFVDGSAANSFLFQNNGAALTIGSLPKSTLGVAFNASTGIPSAAIATGPGTNPLSGVTTQGGDLTVSVTGPGATGFPLTVAAPVLSVGGPIVLTAAGTGGSTIIDAAVGNAMSGSTALIAGSGGISINAPIASGSSIDLNADSNVALTANVSAPAVFIEAFGAITQTGGVITANTLDVFDSGGSVSLPGANAVGTLTGFASGTFLFRDDSHTLTVGCVANGDSTDCGVSTNGSNIVLETTASGNLVLNQTVNANNNPPVDPSTILGSTPGLIGLSSAGTITQDPTNGLIVGSGLEIQSVGAVSLGAANRLGANDVPQSATGVAATPGMLSGDVISAGQSFLFRDDRAGLTIGTVDVVDSFGARQLNPQTLAALPPGGISGVTTANGTIILETTTAGNLLLSQAVGAGSGSVGLASAGTTTQDPAPIIASSLAILSADRVSLGAFGGANDLNQVGTLAGQVLNPGESFVFRNDAANLTIGTVDVVDTFGARMLNPVSEEALTGTLSGVVTNNANIGLRVTTSGNLLLTANVNAGNAGVGLEAAEQIQQTAGMVTGSTVEVSAVGSVSLPDANAVPVVAGQATGAGASFLFRDDGRTLIVGSVSPLLETGTGTPPNNQMLSVAGLSGVVTNNGTILLDTTTAGNLVLSQPVNAGTGSIGLSSNGQVTQNTAGIIIGSGLEVLAVDSVALGSANTILTLAGQVATSGQSFLLRDDNSSSGLTVGTVDVVDTFGSRLVDPRVVPQATPPTLLTGGLMGVVTNNGTILLETTTAGNLVLSQPVNAGTGSVGLSSIGQITQNVTGVIIASGLEVLAVDSVALGSANTIGTLAGQLVTSGQSFLVRDDRSSSGLTVGTVDVVDTFGSRLVDQRVAPQRTPPTLLTDGLIGVVTDNGIILLETTTAGNLVLNQMVNAGTGSLTLTSAGTITQTAPITAQNLVARTQSDTGAAITLTNVTNAVPGNVTLSALNTAGTAPAAGAISFVDSTAFTVAALPVGGLNGLEIGVNTNASVTLEGRDTIRITGAIGNFATGPVSVTADNNDILVNGPITSGSSIDLNADSNVALAANVSAPAVSIEAFGAITQTGGVITANTLDVFNSGGSVSLPGANAVGTLTGFASGTFLFRDDSHTLTVGCVANGDFTDCGVSTNGGNIILETTTSGNLVLNQTVNANNNPPADPSTILGSAPGLIALSSAGTITQDPTNGLIVGSGLEIQSVGAVSLGAANRLGANDVPQSATGVAATPGMLSGDVISAGQSFLLRDDRAGLTIGTVDVVDSFSGRQLNPQTAAAVPPGGISGVTANGGNIILATTTSGNLLLSQAVNAGAGSVGLASAGTTTQDPAPIIASSLAIISADRVSLGAFGGPNDLNQVGTLAGQVLNAGESFVFRNDSANLTIGTVDVVDIFGARMLNPISEEALTGALSGVVTNNANIGLRVTTSGNLTLMANLNARSAGVGLESAGAIQQTAGTVTGSTLEISAVGSVSLPDANAVPVLAGQATGAGSSFLFRDDGQTLTVDAVAPLVETGTGAPANSRMLSVSGLSGVTTANGNIILETTTAGNLLLSQAVNAGAGSVGLASAGTVTQDPAPIIASSLAILSAHRVSLGAFGGPNDLNEVGTLAGQVLNAGESFVFRNDSATLTIGTVDVVDTFGERMLNPISEAPLTGALSGVVTNNANIGLRVTTSGNLILTANVNAGGAGVGLEAAGQIQQTAGMVTGNTLELSGVGPVSLLDANAVPVLAGQLTGAGSSSSFLYRNDSLGLTVGTVPTLLESGTGTPPNNQMLSVTELSGVTTAGGNIRLETTTSGNLALNQSVNAGTGLVTLTSAGTITQTGGVITAASLTGGSVGGATLSQTNLLTNLGPFTNAGAGGFTLTDGQTLNVTGAVGAGTGGLMLTTTSGNLVVGAGLSTGATVTLTSAGTVTEPAGGLITAATLTGSSAGGATLNQTNLLTNLGPFTNAGAGGFALTDGQTLNVTAAVGAGTGGLALTTTSGNLVVAAGLSAGTTVTLTSAGTITEPAGGLITATTLTGSSVGNASFDQGNLLANLGPFTTTANGVFALTDNQALTVSGPLNTGGDLRIRVNTGDLTVAGNLTAGGGSNNAALIASAGNATETGGTVTASGLIVDAAGNVSFGIVETGSTVALGNANSVGTLAGTAGGSFGFLNGPALSVGTVPPVVDVASQSGISASPATSEDVLVQTNSVGQQLTLAGNITAGGRAIFDTAGGFAQTGTVTVTAPVLAIDTTGSGINTLLGFITSPSVNASVVSNLPPTGRTSNPMQFADLLAPNTVALLFADQSAVSGTMQVKQFGLSGIGNLANLQGSINGVTGPTAALLGVRDPGPSATYLFNDCVIAAATCVVIPIAQPVAFLVTEPQMASELEYLTILPNLSAQFDVITPQAVRGARQPEDPDAPVINIFDEEHLCYETANPSQPTREPCREER